MSDWQLDRVALDKYITREPVDTCSECGRETLNEPDEDDVVLCSMCLREAAEEERDESERMEKPQKQGT